MLEKLDLKVDGQIDKNFDYIKQGFPSVITETQDENGKIVEKIDFEKLKQELSDQIIEGKEAYNFTWPGKKKAILEANTPTNKTLRPYREESVNFDTTENLYIEGDNLEVLKLLQNTYFKKVKMIYIDPPYNTGNDFIYNDKFTMDSEEYEEATGLRDEDGDIQFKQNKTSNPRYHSDWCSMIYSRLKLARNLLTDDGVIFISIDDNEIANMTKICNEIFGENNFVGTLIRKTASNRAMAKYFNYLHEYCLLYSKNISKINIRGEKKDLTNYTNPDNDPKGAWTTGNPSMSGSKNLFGIENPYTHKIDYPPRGRGWVFNKEKLQTLIENKQIIFKKEYREHERGFLFKQYLDGKNEYQLVNSMFFAKNEFLNQVATKVDFKEFEDLHFENPKPIIFLKNIAQFGSNNNDIILDFFSGSATTAHAVMQLNAEEMGGGTTYFLGKMAA